MSVIRRIKYIPPITITLQVTIISEPFNPPRFHNWAIKSPLSDDIRIIRELTPFYVESRDDQLIKKKKIMKVTKKTKKGRKEEKEKEMEKMAEMEQKDGMEVGIQNERISEEGECGFGLDELTINDNEVESVEQSKLDEKQETYNKRENVVVIRNDNRISTDTIVDLGTDDIGVIDELISIDNDNIDKKQVDIILDEQDRRMNKSVSPDDKKLTRKMKKTPRYRDYTETTCQVYIEMRKENNGEFVWDQGCTRIDALAIPIMELDRTTTPEIPIHIDILP